MRTDEDFIAMKVYAGSPQDLADAQAAIALDREALDLDLVRALARGYGKDAAATLDRLFEDPDAP